MTFAKNTYLNPAICGFQIANINDVASITIGSTSFHRVVTFKSGKTWSTVYATSGSIKYTDIPKQTGSGPYYEHRLSSFFPGDDAANLTDFDNIENKRFLIKMNLTDGTYKILGDLINPVQIIKSFDSEKGGNIISCNNDSIYRAFILT